MIKNMQVKLKVLLLLVIPVLALLLVAALGLQTINQTLREGRELMLKEIVQSSISLAKEYQKRIDAGEFSSEEGIKQYYAAASFLRFAGKDGYLFAVDDNGITVMHGGSQKTVGVNLWNTQDPNGKYFVRELVKAGRQSGGGYVDYSWTKPGNEDELFAKISFAEELPWGDVIGTGLYIDDLDAEFAEIAFQVGLIALLAMAVTIAIGWIISRDLTGALLNLRSSMSDIASGNYAGQIDGQDRTDELGGMAVAVAEFREQIKQNQELQTAQVRLKEEAREKQKQETLSMADSLQARVQGLVGGISDSLHRLQGVSTDMKGVAQQSNERADEVASATRETSQNVEAVASATEELTASSDEISAQVEKSSNVAMEASEKANDAGGTVESLAGAVSKIGDVVNLIADITEQTNLLALNATIEAARAGDAGKGFAVVASEVRNLANQTAQATAEISNQISEVQSESDRTRDAVSGIREIIAGVAENSTAIAAAIQEQHAAISEIARNVNQASDSTRLVSKHIDDVSNNANKTLSSTDVVSGATDELVKEAEELGHAVEAFLIELREKAQQI